MPTMSSTVMRSVCQTPISTRLFGGGIGCLTQRRNGYGIAQNGCLFQSRENHFHGIMVPTCRSGVSLRVDAWWQTLKLKDCGPTEFAS